MSSTAINSAREGLSAAQAWFTATAISVAHAGLPGESAELIAAIVKNRGAAQAVSVNIASMHAAQSTEKSLIDIFA